MAVGAEQKARRRMIHGAVGIAHPLQTIEREHTIDLSGRAGQKKSHPASSAPTPSARSSAGMVRASGGNEIDQHWTALERSERDVVVAPVDEGDRG
jgi:hypothetical protein